MLLVKAPSKTKLQTNSTLSSISSKVWNGRAWKIWPDFHFYTLGSCCLPSFTGLVDLKRKAIVNRQLSLTLQWDQLFPARAVHSLVQSLHRELSDAAGGERAPLSQPIWFGNLLVKAASISSLFASAFVVTARNPEELFSPLQSSLNLLPPTSSAQLVAEVNHAFTSAGQNTSSRKLCVWMGNAETIWAPHLVVTSFTLSFSRLLVLYHL